MGISEASVASLLEQQDIASFPGQGYYRLLSVANLRQKGMGNELVGWLTAWKSAVHPKPNAIA
ncbi:MAG: hypothetical protein IKB96_03400 [Prevotella sp.]|nr:hypothetical protein [Prevotella sp.]